MSPINNNKRKWQVRNNSNRIITIGDLKKVPSLASGTSHNLLRYATEEQIRESTVLANLISRGILSLTATNTPTSSIDSL